MTNTVRIIKDCKMILKENGTPQHVISHCEAVTKTSINLTRALNKRGFSLNEGTIATAAMLHDIKRTEKNHAELGSHIVKNINEKAADIIAVHMKYNFNDFNDGLTETDIVCLSDRMVKEDKYVGFETRMADIIRKFENDPEAIKRIQEKMEITKNILKEIERITGFSIDNIAKNHIIPFDAVLKKVEKPGRYIGNEINSVKKNADIVRTRFAFVFPDVYEIGMSYTGLEIIYGLLNKEKSIFCERVFTPASDMENIMREKNIPLFTLETKTDIRNMDIVGFTLQYELSFTNVINTLDLAGIPLLSRDRKDYHPLVLGGGPCAFNPEPLADVFDLIVIGDSEEILPALCMSHQEALDKKLSKREFLKEVVKIKGVYVPSFYRPKYNDKGIFTGFEKIYDQAPDRVKKNTIKNLNNGFFPDKPLVPLIDTVHNRAVSEIFRGCSRGCRFCQAGMIYRPVRERDSETIKNSIYKQLKNTGYDEVSLLSLSSGDYSYIESLVTDLIDELKNEDVALSLPSMRLDSLNPDIIEKIGEYRKSSLTFAPEAGTQRLRDVINKNINEDDIFNMVKKAIEIGWNKVKFYFMIGLPTETYEDLDGLCDLIRRVMEFARTIQEKGKRNFSVTVSVSNFVPKPNTPFQWCAGNTEKELLEKNYYIKDNLKSIKGVAFKYHDTRLGHIEMLLAKGDRKTLYAIKRAVERGCKFDSWREFFKYDQWIGAFEDAGISTIPNHYTDKNAELPWDIIDTGVSKKFLEMEFEKAIAGETTPDCRVNCSDCGVRCSV